MSSGDAPEVRTLVARQADGTGLPVTLTLWDPDSDDAALVRLELRVGDRQLTERVDAVFYDLWCARFREHAR